MEVGGIERLLHRILGVETVIAGGRGVLLRPHPLSPGRDPFIIPTPPEAL